MTDAAVTDARDQEPAIVVTERELSPTDIAAIDTANEGHRTLVQHLMNAVATELTWRAVNHDTSRESDPERRWTHHLNLAKRSGQSDALVRHIRSTIEAEHWRANDHHPEHHAAGARGMNAFQVLEWLVDLRAHFVEDFGGRDDAAFREQLGRRADRQNFSPDVCDLLVRTADALGWTADDDTPDR